VGDNRLTSVCTNYAALRELSLGGDAAHAWLAPCELAVHTAMRSTRRQQTFLAGRIVIKQLLLTSHFVDCSPRELEIESRSVMPGHGERPLLSLAGSIQPLSLSIAHSDRGVLVACGDAKASSIGVDLVPRQVVDARLKWTFTSSEREWLAANHGRQCESELLWARKEALYKACQRGEGFRPAAIEVIPGQIPRYPDFTPMAELKCLQTWHIDGHVAALAIATPRPVIAKHDSQPNVRAA
jgi:4'-phosphopantetheinyl transferase EntD